MVLLALVFLLGAASAVDRPALGRNSQQWPYTQWSPPAIWAEVPRFAAAWALLFGAAYLINRLIVDGRFAGGRTGYAIVAMSFAVGVALQASGTQGVRSPNDPPDIHVSWLGEPGFVTVEVVPNDRQLDGTDTGSLSSLAQPGRTILVSVSSSGESEFLIMLPKWAWDQVGMTAQGLSADDSVPEAFAERCGIDATGGDILIHGTTPVDGTRTGAIVHAREDFSSALSGGSSLVVLPRVDSVECDDSAQRSSGPVEVSIDVTDDTSEIAINPQWPQLSPSSLISRSSLGVLAWSGDGQAAGVYFASSPGARQQQTIWLFVGGALAGVLADHLLRRERPRRGSEPATNAVVATNRTHSRGRFWAHILVIAAVLIRLLHPTKRSNAETRR
jgi:hypothetical protein